MKSRITAQFRQGFVAFSVVAAQCDRKLYLDQKMSAYHEVEIFK
ncbi:MULTISPECIES: hypothetical protein [unclassified Nostoc]|nr:MULTISPECIES: hypothetical protein [unclassified Nostoc]